MKITTFKCDQCNEQINHPFTFNLNPSNQEVQLELTIHKIPYEEATHHFCSLTCMFVCISNLFEKGAKNERV
jgi:hypothetical protein